MNNQPVELLPDMRLRHALLSADLFRELEGDLRVYDDWGN